MYKIPSGGGAPQFGPAPAPRAGRGGPAAAWYFVPIVDIVGIYLDMYIYIYMYMYILPFWLCCCIYIGTSLCMFACMHVLHSTVLRGLPSWLDMFPMWNYNNAPVLNLGTVSLFAQIDKLIYANRLAYLSNSISLI